MFTRKTTIFNKKLALLALALSLLLIMLLQTSPALASDIYLGPPTLVEGRILTPNMTGDTVNWVEIAKSGDCSLIVRTDYIRRYANYENLVWDQAYIGYFATTDYMESIPRERINNWFNAHVPYFISTYANNKDAEGALPANARLRDYTVQHNAVGTIGASSLTDGLSQPTAYRVGVGNDIAFALSSSEAANFLSKSRSLRDSGGAGSASPPAAAANFAKIKIPTVAGNISGMWLRSVGATDGTVGGLRLDGLVSDFRAVPQSSTQYAYVYPAVWVNEEIFGSGSVPPSNPIAQYATGVDGRILTPAMTGDICNWVEIAQNGDYSLIVRANFLNIQSFNYGDPMWQSARWQTPRDGTTNVGYGKDNVSHDINCWFNFLEVQPDPQGINTFYDVLPANARLRNYTMQHNALSVLGTRYTATTLTDGLSTPTKYQVGIGDNIAFCLSFSEAANYISITRNFPGANEITYLSPPEAVANFGKVSIPKSTLGFYYAMWLRSPGNHPKTECALLDYGYTHELDVLNSPAGNLPNNYAFGYGLIYPAAWVGQGIFGTTQTVTLSYDANGGVGAPPPQPDIPLNSYAPISDVIPTQDDNDFLGWSTNPLATVAEYQPGGSIFMDGDITLYAVWKEQIYYTLSYDANGGSGAPAEQTVLANTYAIISNDIPTLNSTPFLGWDTNSSATTAQYQPGDPIFMGANIKLYAVWEQQQTRTVTGYVMPMAMNELFGAGGSFLLMHDVVVELRTTFLTPAPAQLSVKAELMNTLGIGQFTFENVPFGNYVLYIKRPGYLARPMLVTVDASSSAIISLAPPDVAEMGIFRLLPGDCNNDDRIDNLDIIMILDLAAQRVNALDTRYVPYCDLDANGLIDSADFNMAYTNWGATVLDYSGSEGVDPLE